MLKFILVLVLSIPFIGCQSNDDQNDDNYSLSPLKLSKQLVRVDQNNSKDTIHIIDGNGGYKIILPKEIFINGVYVNYPENIFTFYIDDENRIIIERTLLNDQIISGLFLVVDKKDQKRLFVTDMPDILGNLYDFEDLEKQYLNKTDFWQY